MSEQTWNQETNKIWGLDVRQNNFQSDFEITGVVRLARVVLCHECDNETIHH